MPTRRPPLSYDVFVAPEKPFMAPPPRVGDPPAWDPTTSTLIFGARDARAAQASAAGGRRSLFRLRRRDAQMIHHLSGHVPPRIASLGLPVGSRRTNRSRGRTSV